MGLFISKMNLFISLLGFIVSILAFFPGWMSLDSLIQYGDALNDRYYDWHPVLYSFIWHYIIKVYDGPGVMLILSLSFFWLGWFFSSLAIKNEINKLSGNLLPLLGFIPSLLLMQGQIWKDILFANSLFFAISLLFYISSLHRNINYFERFIILLLLIFSIGIKTNGLSAIPFVLFFWLYVEFRQKNYSKLQLSILSVLLMFFVIILTNSIVPKEKIVKSYPFQYTQLYDLLAISIKAKKNFLPDYVNQKIGSVDINKLYCEGGNNALFYGTTAGSLRTENLENLDALNKMWINTVTRYPQFYLEHRLAVFVTLLKIKSEAPSYIVGGGIDKNSYGFVFTENKFSYFLKSFIVSSPVLFFPWIYIALILIGWYILYFFKFNRAFVSCVSLSAFFFIFPHFFIVPAEDFRYLYFVYIVAVLLAYTAITILINNFMYKSK